MYCSHCGNALWEGDLFCQLCGARVLSPAAPVSMPASANPPEAPEPAAEVAAEPAPTPEPAPVPAPVSDPEPAANAEPVPASGAAYVPTWDQAFAALSLWQSRLTGEPLARQKRRCSAMTGVLIGLCTLALTLSALSATLLIRSAVTSYLLNTIYYEHAFRGSAEG